MTNPDLTHLYFLLDRSGSMQSIREDTIGGFDAFIADQRTQPGECRVTLAQFDDRYEEVYADRPVAEVPNVADDLLAHLPDVLADLFAGLL